MAGQVLFKSFIDLTQAYDRVDRTTLWKILRLYGLPEKLVVLIAALHEGTMARVCIDGELSEPFLLKRGLKQGSLLSPYLFNIFFGVIINAARKTYSDVRGAGVYV